MNPLPESLGIRASAVANGKVVSSDGNPRLARWRDWGLSLLAADFFLVLTTLAVAVLTGLFCEKIRSGGGLGEDGCKYYCFAEKFYEVVFVRGLDDYNIQRILPSAIVHYALRLFSLNATPAHVIHAFEILNAIVITLSACCWCLIARELQISPWGKWLGFCALYVNYAILKWAPFYPVLTDISAYGLGLWSLYFYLRRRRLLLYATTLTAAFVWSSGLYTGGLLLLFPRDESAPEADRPARYALNYGVAALVTLSVFVYIVVLLHLGIKLSMGIPELNYPPLKLSIVLALLYVFLGLARLLDSDKLFNVKYLVKRLFSRAFLGGLLFIIAVKVLQGYAATAPHIHGSKEALRYVVLTGLAEPGTFALAHVFHYGPFLLLAVFLWKPVCQLIHRQGIGLVAALALALLFGLCRESRFLFNFIPLLVPFVIKVTDRLQWRPAHYAFLAALSLFFSKVWLSPNKGPFLSDPAQYSIPYYQLLSPIIDDSTYLFHLVSVLIGGWLLYRYHIKNSKDQAQTAWLAPVSQLSHS